MSAAIVVVDLLGRSVLHGGVHAVESGEAFHWWYAASSIAIVGGVGGFLYWYFGQHGERR